MRFLNILLGVILVVLGILPLLQDAEAVPSFLAFVPTSGVVYQSILIIIGLVIVVVSAKERRIRLR